MKEVMIRPSLYILSTTYLLSNSCQRRQSHLQRTEVKRRKHIVHEHTAQNAKAPWIPVLQWRRAQSFGLPGFE